MRDTNYTVFITHSSADAWTAEQIAKSVRDEGADTFLSVLDVEGGDDFGCWMRLSEGATNGAGTIGLGE